MNSSKCEQEKNNKAKFPPVFLLIGELKEMLPTFLRPKHFTFYFESDKLKCLRIKGVSKIRNFYKKCFFVLFFSICSKRVTISDDLKMKRKTNDIFLLLTEFLCNYLSTI